MDKKDDNVAPAQMTEATSLLLSGLLMALIGAFIMALSIIPGGADRRIMEIGTVTTGIVESSKKVTNRGGQAEFSTFSYTASDGKEYRITESRSLKGDTPTVSPGDEAKIHYNPASPGKAVAAGWQKDGTVGGVAGGIGLAIGSFLLWKGTKKSEEEAAGQNSDAEQ